MIAAAADDDIDDGGSDTFYDLVLRCYMALNTFYLCMASYIW